VASNFAAFTPPWAVRACALLRESSARWIQGQRGVSASARGPPDMAQYPERGNGAELLIVSAKTEAGRSDSMLRRGAPFRRMPAVRSRSGPWSGSRRAAALAYLVAGCYPQGRAAPPSSTGPFGLRIAVNDELAAR